MGARRAESFLVGLRFTERQVDPFRIRLAGFAVGTKQDDVTPAENSFGVDPPLGILSLS